MNQRASAAPGAAEVSARWLMKLASMSAHTADMRRMRTSRRMAKMMEGSYTMMDLALDIVFVGAVLIGVILITMMAFS
jgi:hypothetical protein